MEAVITNPGFKPISDRIFLRLQVDSLLICRRVSSNLKNFVDYFWFEKLLFVKDLVLTVTKGHVMELLKITPTHAKEQYEVDRLRKRLCAYLKCFTLTNRKNPILAIGSSDSRNPGKSSLINTTYVNTRNLSYFCAMYNTNVS